MPPRSVRSWTVRSRSLRSRSLRSWTPEARIALLATVAAGVVIAAHLGSTMPRDEPSEPVRGLHILLLVVTCILFVRV
ncbi:MAG: hypothetical protein ACRCY9_11610, partial [Phycicoccus sp.]